MSLTPLAAPYFATTLIRLEGSNAEILLPFANTDFRTYVERLREAATFPDAVDGLQALSTWPILNPPNPADMEWLERDQHDAWVWHLQTGLIRLSQLEGMPEFSPGPADGVFGERTEAAVIAFQKHRGLFVDGIAGPATLGALETALAEHGVTAIPIRGVDPPRVGIILSHPSKLVPKADEEIERLVKEVIRMGCRPFLLPPVADALVHGDADERGAAIYTMIRVLDGLLGPGGDDVDPAIYGEPNQFAERTNFVRDRFEAELAVAAMQSYMFMFGICRSHQLWNAAMGGTLVQDVQREGFSSVSQRQGDLGLPGEAPFVIKAPDGSTVFENKVELEPRSQLSKILDGADAILTNSYHHQAVDLPGKGFSVVGTVFDPVTQRRTIEATERWNVITTQFHPEVMTDDRIRREIFGSLGRRARIFRMHKAGKLRSEMLLEKMGQYPEGHFDSSDFDWVREVLAPRIG